MTARARRTGVFAGALLLCAGAFAAGTPRPLPSLREQAEIQQQWLKLRLERVLPGLMRRHGVQMWLVISREYNEDPVFFSLMPPTTMAARRRTILVFNDLGIDQGVERITIGGSGSLYRQYRPPNTEGREIFGDEQWVLLRQLIEDRKPGTIGVDISNNHAFSDGLSVAEYEKLLDALGPEYSKRIVRAEELPLEYLEIRLPEMLPTYKKLMETAHSLIERAFSNEVITPGKTTPEDVEWWFREQLLDLRLATWFQPSVTVQRAAQSGGGPLESGAGGPIQRGDVLHCDFGITGMRLNTDTQHMGYVLREGETAPPPGLQRALKITNRLQDIVVERIRPGRSGNEILADVRARMKAEEIDGLIYPHMVGDHGHAAGPIIGLWDRQEGVVGKGDALVLPNTWMSIELSAKALVPEWNNRPVSIGMEEDVVIDEAGRVNWVRSRQTEYHLVK
jgi:Xaa-Pro aminopeptidase